MERLQSAIEEIVANTTVQHAQLSELLDRLIAIRWTDLAAEELVGLPSLAAHHLGRLHAELDLAIAALKILVHDRSSVL